MVEDKHSVGEEERVEVLVEDKQKVGEEERVVLTVEVKLRVGEGDKVEVMVEDKHWEWEEVREAGGEKDTLEDPVLLGEPLMLLVADNDGIEGEAEGERVTESVTDIVLVTEFVSDVLTVVVKLSDIVGVTLGQG